MKRTNTKFCVIALCISILSFSAGCKKDGMFCVKGKGGTVSEERYETGFTSVNIDMGAELYVSQGTTHAITIEAQGNLMEHIGTQVKNGELRVYNKHCIRKHDPIRVYVTMPTVNGVTIGGSGAAFTMTRIESSTFSMTVAGSGAFQSKDSIVANYMTATVAGSGDMNLMGRFNNAVTTISGSGNIALRGSSVSNNVTINGSGNVQAFNMPVKTCDVTVSGSGHAEVNVADHLTVTLSGSGNVLYKGNPTTNITTSGSGSVLHQP